MGCAKKYAFLHSFLLIYYRSVISEKTNKWYYIYTKVTKTDAFKQNLL